MKSRDLNHILYIIIILCSTGEINATQLRELSLEQMCIRSDEIIEAEIISIKSYRDSEYNNWIFTDIEIKINDNLKGNLKRNEKYTLKLFGGTVDGKTTMIVGTPSFRVGQETVLFLTMNKIKQKERLGIIGLSQGKFDIVVDKITNEKKIKRNQQEIPLKLKEQDFTAILQGSDALRFNDFKTYISDLTRG